MSRSTLDPVPVRRRLPASVYATIFLEAAAALALVLNLVANPAARHYAATNAAPRLFRVIATALPWAGAALATLGLWLTVARRPKLADGARRASLRATPLLVLWAIPLVLDRPAFGEQPGFLMLLAAGLTIGLEASLRRAFAPEFAPRSGEPSGPRTRAVPRVIAAVAIALVMAFLCFGAIRVHHKMLSSNYDLGLFENLFWNALHGRHGIALERQYFSEHAEFLLYVLLPVYALWPATETLLVLQGVLMAGAAVPLFLLAERLLRSSWAAALLAVAYVAHPALHGPAFYDFHFLPLSAFFILWAAYFYAVRRGGVMFWVSVVLAMSCREDVALGAAIVGLGLFWCRRERRLGLALFALGALWFVLVKFVWMQQFGRQSFTGYYAALIPKGERGFGAVLVTVLSNPLYALRHVLTAEKGLLALQLLVPLAFLPLRHARARFLLIPGLVVVGLASSDSAIIRVHFHYATHFVPYAFIAAVLALGARRRAWRWPALMALCLGSLVSTVHFGAFLRERFRTSFHEVSFDWSAEDGARKAGFERLRAHIPDAASVSAGEYEGPWLARRDSLFALKAGASGADFVVYSARSLRWGGRDEVLRALRGSEYGVVDVQGDLTLLGKGHSTAQNGEALRRLR